MNDHDHHASPLHQLWRILRPERREIAFVLIYAVCVGVLSLAVPITASAVVNSVALTTLVQQLVALAAALGCALALAAVVQVIQQVTVEYLQRRVFVRVAGAIGHALPRVDIKTFEQRHGPEIVNRFFDVLTLQKSAATLLLDGVSLALQVFIGLILLASYDTILLGFDVLLLAGLAILVFVAGRGGIRTAINESLAKYDVAAWLEEVARHPVAFKFAAGPRLAEERVNARAERYLEARAEHYRVLLRQIVLSMFLQVIASVGLLAVGGWLVMEGQLTLGQLVAAQIVVNLVVGSLAKVGKQLESWYDLVAASDKVGHLLDLPQEASGNVPLPVSTLGLAVNVRDLRFQFDNQTRPTITDLNLTVAPGERIAIMGPNASGKTTLVRLLLGLHTPQRGWIEFDTVDLRDLNPATLRDSIGTVSTLEIFDGSILDNIRVGRAELPLHDLRAALIAVDLLDEILALPGGLETGLVAGGAPLTLGQSERLMLARSIAANPRLLVYDEALDAVEPGRREAVLNTILDPARTWTVLAVTHSADVAARFPRKLELRRPE